MASKKPTAARDVKMPKNSKTSAKESAKVKAAAEKQLALKNEAVAKQKEENARLKNEIKNLKQNRNLEDTFSYNFMPYILCFAGVFLAVCFVIPEKMNFIGRLAWLLCGLLSYGAVFVPLCMVVGGIFWRADAKNSRNGLKGVLMTCFVSSVAAVSHLFYLAGANSELYKGYKILGENSLFNLGAEYKGGGIIGGVLANFVEKFTGIGAWILFVFLVILLGFAIFNVTPIDMIAYISAKIKDCSYNANVRRKDELQRQIDERNRKEAAAAAEEAEKEKQAASKKKRKAYLGGIDGEEEQPSDKKIPETEEKIASKVEDVDSDKESELEISADALRIATGDKPLGEDNGSGLTLDDFYGKDEDATHGIVPDKDVYDSIKSSAESISFVNNTVETTETKEENDGHPREIDLSEIFTEDAVIASAGVEANTADVLPEGSDIEGAVTEIETDNEFEGEKEELKVTPKPKLSELYKFPSLDLLAEDPNPATFSVTDEVKETALKLVETLATFGVKTKITNICCGPTVTRYELQPEIGVRVKAIQNLSDDIALHLAASGVRIEAPIPGKQAVGIEVPNKTVSTVYIRNLIENPKFAQLKSRLSVALGMDVAGSPVYMDIAKMPHLLIAGATGMGKSVCINSFIVSLLYKARPDECKLLLIDPKKVEFAPYNGMPHLIVPVVSDPKKAAGSLAWAVNEMERRFQLIEEVGVRNIDEYNSITENDPEKEYMAKIVIIIDELADLMMTARDSVESSICRIAQKARAAGMHLIIGTQRPSVDVITGLIKANVPSRIACTVASQTDSRTILDMAGAEKLLGKGDMLYAPVGAMKPTRVQGSFVDNDEIEHIVGYLKSLGEAEYDHDIINSIEKEAEACTDKKKGKGDSGDGDDYDVDDRDAILASDDAMFPAIEIAVDANMISTSLIQRKLSLGYARAARIVDKLEKIGVVGPYEGSKPRKVLITRQEYLEMKLNHENRQ